MKIGCFDADLRSNKILNSQPKTGKIPSYYISCLVNNLQNKIFRKPSESESKLYNRDREHDCSSA